MIRTLARPLLASWFVFRGVSDALEPAPRAREVEPLLEPVLSAMEGRVGASVPPVSTDTLVRLHGGATAIAAATLALSKTPRTAGVALTGLAAVSLATTTPFWRLPEGPERDAAIERFLVQLSLLGGAALAATAGHSAGHVKRKKARKAKAKQRKADAKAKEAAKLAKERAKAGLPAASRSWWRAA